MLGLCLLAPLTFIIAGSVVGPGNSSPRPGQGVGLSFASFLGDDEVSTRELFLQPSLSGWTRLFNPGLLSSLVPIALAILSGFLVGRGLTPSGAQTSSAVSSSGLAALLLLYWIPLLSFAFIADQPEERYLLYFQPLGAALVAAAVTLAVGINRIPLSPGSWRGSASLASSGWARSSSSISPPGSSRLDDRFQENEPSPIPALRYVVANRAPEDFIVVTAPAESYLVLGDDDQVGVVGGALARRLADGSEVDYWIGWPKLGWKNVCLALSEHQETWIVLNADQLQAINKINEIITGATDVVWSAEDGMVVLRSRDQGAWDQANERPVLEDSWQEVRLSGSGG